MILSPDQEQPSGRRTDAIRPPDGSTGTPSPGYLQGTGSVSTPAQPSIGTSPTGTNVTGARTGLGGVFGGLSGVLQKFMPNMANAATTAGRITGPMFGGQRRPGAAPPRRAISPQQRQGLPANQVPAPTTGIQPPPQGTMQATGTLQQQQPQGQPIGGPGGDIMNLPYGQGGQPGVQPMGGAVPFNGGQPINILPPQSGGPQINPPAPAPAQGNVGPNGMPILGGNPVVPQGTEAIPLQGVGGMIERYLANPSRFDNETFQQAYQSAVGDIDQQAKLAQDQAAASAASRGMFFGSPLTTAGTDIATEAGRAKANVAAQLLMNQAQTWNQDMGQALQAALGFGGQQQNANQFAADYALRALGQAFGGAPTIGGTAQQIAGLPGLPSPTSSGWNALGSILPGLLGPNQQATQQPRLNLPTGATPPFVPPMTSPQTTIQANPVTLPNVGTVTPQVIKPAQRF